MYPALLQNQVAHFHNCRLGFKNLTASSPVLRWYSLHFVSNFEPALSRSVLPKSSKAAVSAPSRYITKFRLSWIPPPSPLPFLSDMSNVGRHFFLQWRRKLLAPKTLAAYLCNIIICIDNFYDSQTTG